MSFDLCLGTAQFGSDYGITNTSGKLKSFEISRILLKANSFNISFIDTAQSYGSAEEAIGKFKPINSKFKLISKLSNSNIYINLNNSSLIDYWEESFKSTLKKLDVEMLDSLLVHDVEVFNTTKKSYLLDWLQSLKQRSLVKNIGVSIYSREDLKLFPLERMDIIQMPFSIYDQRLLQNGTLEMLKNFNISIHLRSIFLQGLILTPSANWPNFISKDFRQHHDRLMQYLRKENINILDFIFWYFSENINPDVIVVGISSESEFDILLKSYEEVVLNKKLKNFNNKFHDLYWEIEKDLDPRKW